MKIPFTNIDLALKKSKGIKRGIMPGVEMRNGSSLFEERISFNSLLQIYKTNADIRSATGLIGFYTGKEGWMIKKSGEQIEEDSAEYIQAWNILNSLGSFANLKNRAIRDVKACGNGFIEKVFGVGKQVVGLKNLDPRSMAIVANYKGEIIRYVQKVGGQTVIFKPEEIIHITEDSDIDNEAFGMGKVETVFHDIKTENKGLEAAFHWYENDASPSSYIVLDEAVAESEEEWAKIEDMMKCMFSGSKNKGKTSFIPYLKDVKTVDISIDKFQFLDLRKFVTEKVCTALGVPKFMLGLSESVNNNNGIELQENFYEGTIQPMETILSDILTREIFFPMFKMEFAFKPQRFNVGSIEKRALNEYDRGLLTVRQYKKKTGQNITEEDEAHEYIDSFPPRNEKKFDKDKKEVA